MNYRTRISKLSKQKFKELKENMTNLEVSIRVAFISEDFLKKWLCAQGLSNIADDPKRLWAVKETLAHLDLEQLGEDYILDKMERELEIKEIQKRQYN